MLKEAPPNTCTHGRYRLSWAEMLSYTHPALASPTLWMVPCDMVLLIDLIIQVCRARWTQVYLQNCGNTKSWDWQGAHSPGSLTTFAVLDSTL